MVWPNDLAELRRPGTPARSLVVATLARVVIATSALTAVGVAALAQEPQDEAPIPEQRPSERAPAQTDVPSQDGIDAEAGGAARAEGEDGGDAPSASSEREAQEPASVPPPVATIPLPETKPEEASKPTPSLAEAEGRLDPPARFEPPAITSAAAAKAAAAVLDAELCEADLKARGVVFEVGLSEAEGRCGVLRPLAVTRLSSGITVGSTTRMWCHTAKMLDVWVADSVLPAAEAHYPDRKLTGLAEVSTYVCRNRASGRKISEHARGSAVDIGSFAFEDMTVPVAAAPSESPAGRFLDDVRKGACGPFTTVLGPGTDADHARHFHFDLAARKNGPYCR